MGKKGGVLANEVRPRRVRTGEHVRADPLRPRLERGRKAACREFRGVGLNLVHHEAVRLKGHIRTGFEDHLREARRLGRILVGLEEFEIDPSQRNAARWPVGPRPPNPPGLVKAEREKPRVGLHDVRHLENDVIEPGKTHLEEFYGLHSPVREMPFFERVKLRTEGLDPARYPLSVSAVREIESVRFHPGVTVLAGENGSGKSTILEAIAIAAGFSPEGGTKNFRTETTPQDRGLADRLTLVRNPGKERDGFFLRAESGYVLMTYINEIESPGMPTYGDLHSRSHGESFMDIFQRRFGGSKNCLFILDEIESALSPQRQLEFLALMHAHVERGSSFLVSTHSPILMSYPRARLYWLDGDGIAERDWRETDHAVILQGFLKRPEEMHRTLFGGDL